MREALKLALEFIERTSTYLPTTFDSEGLNIYSTIKAALAAPVQEPVALTGKQRTLLAQALAMLEDYAQDQLSYGNDIFANGAEASAHEIKKMLTTPPAAQKWVGLTDEEIQTIHDTYYRRMGPQEFALMLEQRLKEKNT